MNEHKNNGIVSENKSDKAESEAAFASDEVYIDDFTDPDDYLDQYMYDYFTQEDMCMSCIHWNGYMCDSEQEKCNYQLY